MSSKTSIFNRQIINDPKLQFGVTSFFVILGLVNFSFFIILFKLLEARILEEINQLDEVHKKYFLLVFNGLSSFVFQSAVVFGIFVIVFSIVGGILILQHISGPSFAIKRFLSDLAEDRKPRYPLKFRKYDFFNDHADLLNQLYEKYEKK